MKTAAQRAAHATYMRAYNVKRGIVRSPNGEALCECGRQFLRRSHNQRACPSCSKKRALLLKREASRRSRGAEKTVICVMCGASALRTSSAQKTCVNCRPAYWAKLNDGWRTRNPDTVAQIRKRHYAKRRSDPVKRLNANLSGLIGYSLKTKGGRSWESLVKFSLDELIAHLEKQFRDGMTWENYGQWHVDHVRPIASFAIERTGDEGFRACWQLTNLQPLWAKENRVKSSTWNGRFHRATERGVAV